MTGAAVFVAILTALLVWMLRGARGRGRARDGSREAASGPEELEAAEREVAELESGQDPDDEWAGSDWGPGAPRPRHSS